MPMWGGVPAMLRIADSRFVVFMSCIFCCASSLSCFFVILPTLVLFGSFEPEPGFFVVARPAAFLRSTLAGGVFRTKVNERSEKTVITTGMIMSPCEAVLELQSLQNAMMFTPGWPSAGPTGGDGLAFPAGSCNLTYPVIFFAIARYLSVRILP